ncbi:MAG: hypothetical protein FWH26_01305 [Oscillospiraceae bacterium]|nr:hypothetical protein [Oscillospiraceae bacterium]
MDNMQGFAYQQQYVYPPQQNAWQYQAVQQQPFDAPDDCGWDALLEQIGSTTDAPPPQAQREPPAEAATITKQQLRSLNRRHLLIMVCNLQERLRQEIREKERMLLAYQAGSSQGRQ